MAEEKRQRAKIITAKRLRNEAAADRARRAAAEQARKVAAANKAVSAVSKTISKFAEFTSKIQLRKR